MNIQLDQQSVLRKKDIILIPYNYLNGDSNTEYIVTSNKGNVAKLVQNKGYKWMFRYDLDQLLVTIKWWCNRVVMFFTNIIDSITYSFRNKKLNEEFRSLLKSIEHVIFEHNFKKNNQEN
jgi:hypothetical protein